MEEQNINNLQSKDPRANSYCIPPRINKAH